MGEKVEAAKNDNEKKAGGDAGQKKDDRAVTAVFKIEMHCDGCAKKIRRAAKHLEGVSEVKTDSASNKLTVTGKLDPAAIKSKLESKIKRKIEIVSPQPKKDGDKKADEKAEKKIDEKAVKKSEEKVEKKIEEKVEKKIEEKVEKKIDEKAEKKKPDGKSEKKSEEKKPKEITAVLKMRLHCEGCIQKIRKALIKFKGVDEITVDAQKDLITVKGAIDGKDVAGYLKGKFSRSVEVIPSKKEEPAAAAAPVAAVTGGDKKEKEGGGGGGDKKEAAASGGDGGGSKMEVNKMEYSGYSYTPSTFYYGGGSGQPQYSYAMEAHHHQPSDSDHHYGFANSSGFYANSSGYHPNYAMYDSNNHPPQMFSDENPNACSVM